MASRGKHSTQAQVGTDWLPASVPLVAGLDARTNRKSRSKEKLTELKNGRFVNRNSIGKRAGHRGYLLSAENPVTDEVDWIEGLGDSTTEWFYGRGRTGTGNHFNKAPGVCRGVATIDNTLVAWTGDQLYKQDRSEQKWNRASVNFISNNQALIPASNESTFVFPSNKDPDSVSVAQGNNYRVVAWRSGTEVYVRVISLATGEHIVDYKEVSGASNDPEKVHAFYLDGFILVLWNDATGNDLYWVKINDGTGVVGSAEVKQGSVAAWDYDKYDDSTALLVWMEPGFTMRAEAFDSSGTVTSWLADNTTLDPDGVPPAAREDIACAVGFDRRFAVMWPEGGTATPPIRARYYNENGSAAAASVVVQAAGNTQIAMSLCRSGDGFTVGYTESTGANLERTVFKGFSGTGMSGAITRHRTWLVSKMFTVGYQPFCLLTSRPRTASSAPVQSNYYLFAPTGFTYQVAGVFSYGEAGGPPGGPGGVDIVVATRYNFDNLPGQTKNQRTLWVGGITEREGNYAQSDGTLETKGRILELDFLPRFRTAKAGSLLYIAGALPRAYDGVKLTEAGFYEYPEVVSSAKDVNGALTALGVYRYRVYFCKRMKDGSVFRSPTLTSPEITLAGAEDEITLTVNTLSMTADADVYYEVYRTKANESTPYYLVSGHNPQTANRNIFTAGTTTINDRMSDAVAAVQLQDSFNPGIGQASELEESGPPGCAALTFMNDRLWAFGGSIEPGKVVFSKVMEIGEGVGWDDLASLEYSIDRTGKPITAIGSIMSIPVLFRENDAFAIAGNGPDNFGLSQFDLARFVSTDVGALNQESLTTCPEGLVFWSRIGPRIITNNLQLQIIGDEIEPLTDGFECRGTVTIPEQSQVRFYGRDDLAFVWDYVTKQWSTYTGLAAEGVCIKDNVAVIARADGYAWIEDETLYTDGGHGYEFSFAIGDLSADELIQGAHRWRRWALVGEWMGPHELMYEVYKSGSNVLRERGYWNAFNDLGLTLWGSGSGTFGVNGSSIWSDPTEPSTDGVYRTRRRFKATTQKASLIRMRFSDQGVPNNSFVATELAFELGLKPGLTRLPARTFE